MNALLSEFIGTSILIILGNGVVANVLLKGTKGHSGGWIVIAFGWAIAVFVAVFIAAPHSGAHLNPAVTLGLAISQKFSWALVPGYMAAQMAGGIFGAACNWLNYKPHYDITEDNDLVLATFSTSPAIKNTFQNMLTEVLGTFILVFAVLFITGPYFGNEIGSLGSLDALPVALVVLGIGLSLGGPTGYAINPARDMGPRIAHALLPLKHKGSNQWWYSWIPVVGPLLGAAMAALVFIILH